MEKINASLIFGMSTENLNLEEVNQERLVGGRRIDVIYCCMNIPPMALEIMTF